MRLEDKLMEDVKAGKEIDIERALLIFSGLETEEKIAEYKLKLDILDAGFQIYMDTNFVPEDKPVKVAKALHDYLWKEKKERYNSNYFLTDVIDAQLSLEDKRVGDCVGLKALYTVLGLKHGLKLSVLLNIRHIMSRLKAGTPEEINIEHTLPGGFDVKLRDYFQKYDLRGLLVTTLIKKAAEKREKCNFSGALDDLNKARQFDVCHSNLYTSFGLLKESKGDLEDAILDYEKVIEHDPKYLYPYYQSASAKIKLNDWEGARKVYKRALAVKPRNKREILLLGKLKTKMKDYQSALKEFNKAKELDNRFVDAFVECGCVKLEQGDFKGALTEFKAAILLEPKDRFVFKNLIYTRAQLNDYKEAVKDYDTFIGFYPDDADLYCGRSDLKEKTGDIEGAGQDRSKAAVILLK